MKKTRPKFKKILKNFYYRVKKFLKKYSLKSLNSIVKSFKDNYKDYFKLGAEIVIYGVVINFILYTLFCWNFNFKSLVAFGFIFYLIKEELPEIIRSCKR